MQPGETTPRMIPHENGVPSKLPPLQAIPNEPAELPPALTDPPGVDNLLATLRRRWGMILTIGLGSALLAFLAVWWFVPGRYSSSMIIAVAPKMGGGESEHASFARRQPVILKNPQLLTEVLTHSAVQELRETQDHSSDQIAWLQQALVIDTPQGAGFDTLRVTLQGEYPEDLPVILTTLKQVYLRWHQNEVNEQSRAREEQARRDLQQLDERIAGKVKEIADLRNKLGLTDNKALEQKMADLRDTRREHGTNLIRERSEQRRLQQELDDIRAKLSNPQTIDVPLYELNEQIRTDPDLRQQQDEITKIKLEIASIEKIVAPSARERSTRALRENLQAAEKQYFALQTQLRPRLEIAARARRLTELTRDEQRVQTSLDKCKSIIAASDEAVRLADQELTALQRKAQVDEAGTNPELESLKRELERLEDSTKTPAELLNQIKLERNSGVRVSFIQDPLVPRERTTDRKWKYGAAAALGAFMLTFLCVALFDFRVRRVNSASDITRGLGLSVVGTLPMVPNRDARQLLVMDESETKPEQLALREAIDGIRTVVLHACRQQPLQVLLVTSALSGEGKTTLSSQLASSLARSGRRTLLVDCDLRDPACHDLFNRSGIPGVSEVLRGEIPVEDAIQTTEQAQLFLLPAGLVNAKTLQALSQDVPRTLFGVLRGHFDFVIVDTSPMLPVSDTLQLAGHADGVLLSIMEQSSKLPAIHEMQQRLSSVGVRVLGAVVGGTQQGVYLYGSRSRANPNPKEV